MDSNQRRFIEDTLDLLNELDEGLMQLEANPLATAPLEQVFRTMHTIKGAANMFGFDNIGELAHHTETLFDKVRQGRLQVSDGLISMTFQAFDKVRYLLQKNDIAKITEAKGLKSHLAEVTQFLKDIERGQSGLSQEAKELLATYALRITPTIQITKDGNHPLIFIIKDLETLGEARISVHVHDDQFISHWNVIVSTTVTKPEIESYFIFVESDCKVAITDLVSGILWHIPSFGEAVDGFLKDLINESDLKTLAEGLSKDRVFDLEKKVESESQSPEQRRVVSETVIKVSKHKVDDLLNWISELVILQARLLNIADRSQLPELNEITEQISNVTHHLRDTSLEIGLVPIESLVVQFKRLVRDLSKSLGKKVNFLSKGTDTEIDKDVIEMIRDPLIHLVRNAVDHGIEKPDDRKASGKQEHGIIRMKAYRSSTFINLVVSDDGRGIDKKKVLEKAISKGVVDAGARLTDEDTLNLIFHPGLSTSEMVSDISGRGVGMDVVRQKLSELRASISITSQSGEGTSFHIKLPLSRSIIDGLLVKVGATHYVVPLAVVERIDRIPYPSLQTKASVCKDVMVNEQLLPVFLMRENFHQESTSPKTADIISVDVNGFRKGIAVDSVVGKIQAVLKPLADIFSRQDFISGSTILGDGSMALVLDTHRLFSESNRSMNQ